MARHRPHQSAARLPWWLFALGLLGVLTLWAIVADAGYTAIFTTLSKGVVTTLWVTGVSFALAMALGLVLAMMRTSGNAILVQVSTFYVELI